MQTRMIAGVAKLVLAVAVFTGMTTAQAQTTDRTDEYKAEIASIEHFNEVQREAEMPEMDIPSYEEWLKTKQEAEASAALSIGKPTTEDAQTRWAKRLEEVRPYLCTLVRPGDKKSDDHRSQVARQEKEQLMRVADQRWAERDEVERKLDEIAARLGVERKRDIGEGRSAVLAGEMNGEAVWLVSQNQIAAASISADELWPTNTAPWPSSSTGLDLTGTNVLLGMWEVDGTVRESHYEFQGRVVQIDGVTNLNYHATGVAGTMAAGGVLYFTSPATGRLMRGVAYQADVDAYDIDEFQAEIADAAAGTTNEPGLRLANHSWGLANGWIQQDVPVANAWVWRGFWDFAEDAKFGYYTPSFDDGTGCVDLDAFLATNATRHLLVYAAGNDRLTGPGTPTDYYFYQGGWYFIQNPGSGDRDWINGDGNTYSFDTMAAPGTAKNVLTVGSVQDVFHTVGAETNWGYASNSTVTLSTFSACGPTDDGRIKPDVVAVGEANPSARAFPIVTADADSDTDAQGQGGTSFAAPGVTAGLALPFQRRNQLFTNLSAEADAFRGSSWKGLAIHTADDVGTVGPDYQTGWGLFNAVSAVRQVELDATHGRGTHIKEIELAVGETNSWLIQLDGSQYKGTVLWTDPAGAPSETVTVDPTTPMLVNNIDFWLETEDGSATFLPWVLDPDLTNKTEAARATAATTGYDDRNNIEQVVIVAPTAGTYRVFVTHAGGTAGGQSPTNQWITMLSDGDIPFDPAIKEFEQSPSTNEFLLSFECDPGASLILESTTNLLAGASWQQEGTLTTEWWTNAVVATSSAEIRFWRLRRDTGN